MVEERKGDEKHRVGEGEERRRGEETISDNR